MPGAAQRQPLRMINSSDMSGQGLIYLLFLAVFDLVEAASLLVEGSVT